MLSTYQNPVFDYVRSPDQDAASPMRRPVIVIGAGPVGMAAAIDLAQQQVPVIVLDDDNTVSVGSRAVCYAKRSLEILDRLGCGSRAVDKGITWNVGKVFFGDKQVYSFNLLPEAEHKRPAFINLQQYYLEEYLLERLKALPGAEVRWKNKVVDVRPQADGVELTIETPEGPYRLACDWLIVADGARSPVRGMLGLESRGQVFKDRFLIADVVMKAEFPTERWFWFDPPFHRNQSALLHRQADDVWRIDFQLGWDVDPEEEKKPEKVIPRIKAMLGDDRPFELEWVSVYTFQCRRMDRFRHGRVIFAGDSAHQVSPFGARGANGGFQDTDNLAWKLALVMQGKAPERLLDSYDVERGYATDENIRNSTRSTDFITPKSKVSRIFRDAVLELSEHHPFARALVNSGRLSMPATLHESLLNTPDADAFDGRLVPGAPACDAPIELEGRDGWLIDRLGGRFQLLVFSDAVPDAATLDGLQTLGGMPIAVEPLVVSPQPLALPAGVANVVDRKGLVAARWDGQPGTAYLLRPDQHVTARWRELDVKRVRAALARATAQEV